MIRIIDLSLLSNRLRLIVVFIVILSFYGCATTKVKVVHEEYQPIELSVAKEDAVIGRLAFIGLEKGDTLPDIARHFDLESMQSVRLIRG